MGLYLNPLEKALVLCCDEKSQCQALERTQPGLPLGPGVSDSNSPVITSTAPSLSSPLWTISDCKIISRNEPRHTNVEWLRFLKQLDRETPKT